MNELIETLNTIDNEVTAEGKPLNVKLTPTERRILGELAKAYERPMATVIKRLIRQAYIDYKQDGQALGLMKYIDENSRLERPNAQGQGELT
jgi:hypothetical protein